jgi:rod shape-determining protein MreD
MISGAILDLFSNDPMGVHALNYTLIALTLYRYKRFFSYEQPFHLGLFTFFVSFTSTLLQIFLLFLFDRRIPFTGEWVFGDLLIMPIADALYAIVWFAYPLKFFEQGRPFWHKLKKRIFPTTL